MTSWRRLFRGQDLSVNLGPQVPSGVLVITFTPWAAKPQPDDAGFGLSFLASRGVNVLCFVSHRNHWWQSAEMSEALEIARRTDVFQSARRRVAYGSSMGAYGALLFAPELRVDRVLALSPQYSVNPAKVPFEERWKGDRAELGFIRDDLDEALAGPAQKWVVYDPVHEEDAAHVALMHGTSLRKERLYYAGHHPVTFALNETRTLKELVDAVTLSDDAASEVKRVLRRSHAARRSSSSHVRLVARRCEERHPRWSVALLEELERRGAELTARDHLVLGRALAACGRLREAFESLLTCVSDEHTARAAVVELKQLFAMELQKSKRLEAQLSAARSKLPNKNERRILKLVRSPGKYLRDAFRKRTR